jgi:hypothetical protein
MPTFVHCMVLFPNGARLSLRDVPTNTVLGTAPAAFTLDEFITFLKHPHRDRSKELAPQQVEQTAYVLEAGLPPPA